MHDYFTNVYTEEKHESILSWLYPNGKLINDQSHVYNLCIHTNLFRNVILFQKFGFTSTNVGIQAPVRTTVGSIDVPDNSYQMIPNQAAQDHWSDAASLIDVLIDKLQLQYGNLTNKVAASKVYFDNYIIGNQLNSDFYR